MGTTNNKVQRQFKQPENEPNRSQIAASQGNTLTVPNPRSTGVPPRSPGPPRNQTTSIIVEPEKPINASNKGQTSAIRASSASSGGKDRIVQLNQSTIYFKSEKALEASSIAVSAIRVKGFEGPEYQGRKVKRFQIAADIPEKELIKESNYFDESNGDIGVSNLVPAKYGNFSLGEFNQINTFPVKTYLFDVALNQRLQA